MSDYIVNSHRPIRRPLDGLQNSMHSAGELDRATQSMEYYRQSVQDAKLYLVGAAVILGWTAFLLVALKVWGGML